VGYATFCFELFHFSVLFSHFPINSSHVYSFSWMW
jgi:hypothetical protein